MGDNVGGERVMTVREAGKKGGTAVRQKYGLGFYSEIGKKGGFSLKESRGSEYYVEIGRKGGMAVRKK